MPLITNNIVFSFKSEKEIYDYVANQRDLEAEMIKRGVSIHTNIVPGAQKQVDDAKILQLTNKIQELENEAYNWQKGYYANVGRLNDIDSTISQIKGQVPTSKQDERYNEIQQQLDDLRNHYKMMPVLMTEKDKEGIEEQIKAITNTITLVKSNLAKQLSDSYQTLLTMINNVRPKEKGWVAVTDRSTLTEESILLVCYSWKVDEKNPNHYTDKTTNNARVVKYEIMTPPDPELITKRLEVDGKEYPIDDPKIISIKEWRDT